MAKKIRVGVVFGGRSGEHEVSLRSAESIINALDKKKYDIVPIGITQAGRWLTAGTATKLLPAEIVSAGDIGLAMLGDPTRSPIIPTDRDASAIGPIDVLFPVLHGTFGEDGTIQGLFDMANIPYVGCGVLASALGMDKVAMKHAFRQVGLPIVDFQWFTRRAWEENPRRILAGLVRDIGFPAFVKPANLGSSVGISKAVNRKELTAAIDLAARYDRKIIVEKGVEAREIEVAILGNDDPIASPPGEILPGADFYDYADKYLNSASRTEIPAKLPAKTVKLIQKMAIAAFRAIDGSGLSRVDFFVEKATGAVLVNEINTMPGFTSISMYPKMWEAGGLPYRELLDRLIDLAFDRFRERSRSKTTVG